MKSKFRKAGQSISDEQLLQLLIADKYGVDPHLGIRIFDADDLIAMDTHPERSPLELAEVAEALQQTQGGLLERENWTQRYIETGFDPRL